MRGSPDGAVTQAKRLWPQPDRAEPRWALPKPSDREARRDVYPRVFFKMLRGVKRSGVSDKFANADESVTNHRVCDKDAWMNGGDGHDGDPLASFHPNGKPTGTPHPTPRDVTKTDLTKGTHSVHARTRRRRRTAVVGTVAGTLTLLAVAAAGNAVDTTPSTAAPTTTASTTAAADGAIPPALLQRRNEVFDRITRLSTTLGKRADFDFSVGVNPNTNTLVVDVFSDKKVKLPNLGADLKLENHVGGQLSDQSGVSGGTSVNVKGKGACTMGFAVRINNSQNESTGFLTAAHCFDQTKPAANSKFRIKADNGIIVGGVGHKYGIPPLDADWGVVALKKGNILHDKALGQLKAFGNKTFPVTGLREPFVDMKVCKNGTRTQTTCGKVTAVGVRKSLDNIIADGLIQTNVCTQKGDSGGPLFTDPTPNATTIEGVGLVKGGHIYADPKKPKGDKVCGEKVGKPNVAWFVPLSMALTQANTQAPQNDISLLTQ